MTEDYFTNSMTISYTSSRWQGVAKIQVLRETKCSAGVPRQREINTESFPELQSLMVAHLTCLQKGFSDYLGHEKENLDKKNGSEIPLM